ncbi:phosphodiester glycosidase family protein [Paenibacillus tarimensis]|uniref:phosphodiester glycosidase family protein n=1 Tax=Paenibacillus tarimensis TaxID=416012 RepID=UPI001F479FBB|nr:phosphodiester glycosidase family protein [Paenibacillus tarimensis]MCF2945377.1 phosphodiester glycosidase family protein [Paenibacillus tarimensis]
MALPYTFELKQFNEFGAIWKYAVIKTALANVKPEIINAKMSQKPHIGINGGFFHADNGYDNPPTGLRSISYWKGETAKYEYNGTASKQISRKTFVTYTDTATSTTVKAAYMYASNLTEVLNRYPHARAVIGGNDYNEESWGTLPIIDYPKYYLATWRTVLAYDNTHAYMIVVHDRMVNIPTLKNHMVTMGFDPVKSVVLDGSGSSTMRVVENDTVKWYGAPERDRYIGNMVRVYGIDWFS